MLTVLSMSNRNLFWGTRLSARLKTCPDRTTRRDAAPPDHHAIVAENAALNFFISGSVPMVTRNRWVRGGKGRPTATPFVRISRPKVLDGAFDLTGVGKVNVGLVHQQDGVKRQVRDQPVNILGGSKRGSWVVWVAQINQSTAGVCGLCSQLVNVIRPGRSQWHLHHL